MKLSIITATKENGSTIREAIISLLSQKDVEVEHIVKDGGSTDETLDIIRGLNPSSKIFTESDSGLYDALNQALEKCTGNIVGLLHADDLFAGEMVLSDVVKLFEVSNCDAVYGDLQYVDRQNPEKVIRNWKSGEYKDGAFLKGWMPPHPAFFVRREVIEKYGNYNTDFQSAADYEWMLRLIHKHRIKLAYLPRVLVKMRVGGKSNASIGNRLRANMEDRRAWKVNGLEPKWYTLWLKPLRKLSQWF